MEEQGVPASGSWASWGYWSVLTPTHGLLPSGSLRRCRSACPGLRLLLRFFAAATKFAEAAVATVVPWLLRPCGLSSVLCCSGWRSDTCRREAQAAEVVGYS